jgi:c-di-GMP phosphodiesterase
MKRRARRLLVYGFGGGVLAILPIIGSWGWTYVATLEQAQERVDEVAAQVADNVREVLQTAEEVLMDMSRAANDGCTDELVREMRTKAATLYAMRDIGYVTADGFLVCNSYGRLEPPRSVGSAQTLEPEGSGIIITPPVATVFTPGKSIIIARRLSEGDFVNILVPPELLLRPLKPGVLSSGDSVEVTIQDVTLAALGKRPRAADQSFWAEESVGMLDARVRATADRVLELEKWRQLTLINAAIGGMVGLVVVAVAIRLAMRRPSLGDELREALDQNEFIVHYQPVMNLQENRCVGAEALIRWRHPQRGVVAPDVFIALAEETGVIVPMTRWLMNRVGEELGELLRADDGFHIAINLAPIHFVDLDVVTDAKVAAEKSQIPPKQMLFEITERGPDRLRFLPRGDRSIG